MLHSLGDTAYSMYQVMSATFLSLGIVDIGIQTLTIRYVSICRATNDGKRQNNILFHLLSIVFFVSLVVLVVGWLLLNNIHIFYPQYLVNSYNQQLYNTGLLMLATVIFMLFVRLFDGIICAYEKFVFSSCIKVVQITARFLIIFFFVPQAKSGIVPATADFVAIVIMLSILSVYAISRLKIRFRAYHVDYQFLKEVLPFGASIILGNILSILNGKIDTIFLGSLGTAAMVKTYTISEQIFHFFIQAGETFSLFFMPQASLLIAQNASVDKLQEFIIKPTRILLIMCLTIIAGFVVLGQQFIEWWLGTPNTEIWITCILLMSANLLVIMQSLFNKLMLAKLANKVCTAIMFFIAAANCVLTFELIQIIGYWGAPIGTVIATLVGWGIFMPVYFKCILKVNVWHIFREISRGVTTSVLASTIFTWILFLPVPKTKLFLIVQAASLIVCILFVFYKFGATMSDKLFIEQLLKKCRRMK